jgi:5-methylcytosine-specific restriction endonuclease McrA
MAKTNKELCREYYLRNRQRMIDRAAKYKADHPQMEAEYRERNREKLREVHRIEASPRRAIKASAGSDTIHPLIVLEHDDGMCGICGDDVDPLKFHVDHVIPLARGGSHTYDNVQAAHPTCNIRKGARLVDSL